MVLYFDRRAESTTLGLQLVRVRCERCECEYYYQLARVGRGRSTAVYGIGYNLEARAQQRAEHNLQEQLATEADLVPCPDCHWINEAMAEGYRRPHYRQVEKFAFYAAIVGTCCSLVVSWFLSIGPPSDRELAPYALIGGLAVSVTLAAGVIFLMRWLRSCIQPNRDYPLPPRVPEGSPPALLLDKATGELRLAKPELDLDGQDSLNWINFQIGRHSFAPFCCECLATVDTPRYAVKLIQHTPVELQVPRCRACAWRSRWKALFTGLTALVLALGAGAVILNFLKLEREEFAVVFGGWSLISLGIAAVLASVLTTPVRTLSSGASPGIVRLRFRNRNYRPGTHILSAWD